MAGCNLNESSKIILNVVKRFIIFPIVALTGLLTSCTGYPRLVNYPFDPGGLSLNSPAAELTPAITSRYIVFVSDRRGRQDIYLYDWVNERLIEVPGLNALDTITSKPSISEDGRYIVFAATRQGQSGIFLYDRETRQSRNLTANLPAEVRNPTMSADGQVIAFESSENGQWDIKVYDRFGQPFNIPMQPR